MPNTRPGISFDDEGVCSACRANERKNNVDYALRWKALEQLCEKYRGMNGNDYDCAIAVSGGKDSYYQVYIMKEKLKMNPILFYVEDNFTMTEAGKHNIKNLSEEFGCPIISLKPNIKAQKKIMRGTFEKYGKPVWCIERLIYTFPLKMAIKFNTPLLVYGENISYEYGGYNAVETFSAKEIMKNGVASDIPDTELLSFGINENDLVMFKSPTKDEIDLLEPIYLGYFTKWNSYNNYNFAKKRGFHDLSGEWDRTMMVENFDQVDSIAYLIHAWLKYPKFGHACATDMSSRFVRYGLIDRKEAINLVKERDYNLDGKCVRDFCAFTGYSEKDFWEIIDGLYNRDLFVKNSNGDWVLKNPIWE